MAISNRPVTGSYYKFCPYNSFYAVSSHLAAKDIELAYQKGLMIGVDAGKFNPEGTLTQDELAVCLDRR